MVSRWTKCLALWDLKLLRRRPCSLKGLTVLVVASSRTGRRSMCSRCSTRSTSARKRWIYSSEYRYLERTTLMQIRFLRCLLSWLTSRGRPTEKCELTSSSTCRFWVRKLSMLLTGLLIQKEIGWFWKVHVHWTLFNLPLDTNYKSGTRNRQKKCLKWATSVFFTRRNDSIRKSKVMYGLFLFRNKDGFLTMGEIKLVNKNATKSEIKVRYFCC